MYEVHGVGCGFAVRFGQIQDDPVMDDMPDFKMNDMPVGNKLYIVERKSGKLKVTTR